MSVGSTAKPKEPTPLSETETVIPSSLGDRVDVLSDLVLHDGFTIGWDIGGAYRMRAVGPQT
jgi:hypothetical protein